MAAVFEQIAAPFPVLPLAAGWEAGDGDERVQDRCAITPDRLRRFLDASRRHFAQELSVRHLAERV